MGKDLNGRDSFGKTFPTLEIWWKQFNHHTKQYHPPKTNKIPKPIEEDDQDHWYKKSINYWHQIDATNHGMLGGFSHLTDIDLIQSHDFLQPFFVNTKSATTQPKIETNLALDIGAGIGRITRGLLSKYFQKTELVEQCNTFIEQAKLDLNDLVSSGKVTNFHCSTIQNFVFSHSYDIIWIQWVLLYLIDKDLIDFLKKAKNAIHNHHHRGIIIIKESYALNGFYIDHEDHSITRSESHLKSLFKMAGLELIHEKEQDSFPSELFPIKMYALS